MLTTERYEFTETGVGCAQHGDPACLCDVDLERVGVQPIRFMPHELTYSGLARDMAVNTDDKVTFEGWAAWLCTIKDEADRCKVSAIIEVLDAARKNSGTLEMGQGLLRAYNALIGAGYDTPKAADILNTTVERLYKVRCEQNPEASMASMGLDNFLLMEQLVLEGQMTAAVITEAVGLPKSDRHTAFNYATRMGVTLPNPKAWQEMRRPDVLALIDAHPELTCSAMAALILEELGVKMSRETVARRRRGKRAGS